MPCAICDIRRVRDAWRKRRAEGYDARLRVERRVVKLRVEALHDRLHLERLVVAVALGDLEVVRERQLMDRRRRRGVAWETARATVSTPRMRRV